MAFQSVYNLIMIDEESSYDNHIEAFNIGLFSSYDKAEITAKRYLTEVEGFKDYPVSYQIIEKRIIGDSSHTELFMICGWNENNQLDEIDVIESHCYTDRSQAEQELNQLKTSCCRKEWCINKFIINECDWQEGFIKIIRK